MPWQTILDLSLVALGVFLVNRLVSSQRRTAPLPPGPKGWPIIGNVFDMGTEKQWLTFSRWADTWGGLIYLNAFGQPIVIVNSLQTAIEMLDKKGNMYSGRPTLPLAGDIVGFARGIALMPYGDRWREGRRMMHKLLGTRASMEKFNEVQETETHRFLRRVLERPDPGELQDHIRVTDGAIILAISHGYIIKEENDHFVKLAEDCLNDFSEATVPGAFLVDTFPILRFVPDWFPGTAWKVKAKQWRTTLDRMVDEPHEYVKQQMRGGTAIPSFTSAYLEQEKMSPEKEEVLKWTAVSIMGGGADTTVSSTYSFFLAMTLHPRIQRKAQAELDAVVGTERLPTLNDRQHLPYVEAISKEILRWNPVGPLNLPHRLMEDDIQDGYFIPEGTMVIANIWKFLHDEKTYKNPSEFYPERYIATPDTKAEPDPRLAFGLGRRSCPGMNLAESSLFLVCAMSLSVFNISKVVENGVTITPAVDYTDGTISHPKPFKCSVKPRSKHAVAIIKSVEFNQD